MKVIVRSITPLPEYGKDMIRKQVQSSYPVSDITFSHYKESFNNMGNGWVEVLDYVTKGTSEADVVYYELPIETQAAYYTGIFIQYYDKHPITRRCFSINYPLQEVRIMSYGFPEFMLKIEDT